MGWRFVRQPNGLLARFSESITHFTDSNMNEAKARELCLREHSMTESAAAQKVRQGAEDWDWAETEKAEQGYRWKHALQLISLHHGETEASRTQNELGKR